MKRTGLRRSSPLQRGKPLARRSGGAKGGRLAAVSAKKRAEREDPQRDVIRQAVLVRDRFTCVLRSAQCAGPCFGGLSMHHRKKEGQGGAWSIANLVTMCIGHNDRIESDADLAAYCREVGLVLSAYD